MTPPAVNVELLSLEDSFDAVVGQSAHGTVCRDAAVNDWEVEKVDFGL